MTIHITALGSLIAWGWVSFSAAALLTCTSAVEGKAKSTVIHFIEALVLLFILLNV